MRVLLFTSSYAPRTGGLETVTRRLAGELADRGHHVLVATNRYPRTLPSREYIDGVPVHRQLYPNLVPSAVRGSRPQSSWSRRVKEAGLLCLLPLVLARLAILVLRFRPDVINAHYFSYPTACMLLVARLLRRPVVLSFHGSDLSSVPYPANYKVSLQIGAALADGYTACSKNLLSYLESVLTPTQRRDATVIYNGIDLTPVQAAVPAVPDRFVFVSSRLVEKKGVRVVIEMAAILRKRGNGVAVVVAGDGPERAGLERLAAELGVASSIVFLGSVPHEVSRALAGRSSVVVVPSYWEAFGMVALEAMAAGKAVVASNTGGLPEIVLDGETGLLVPPGDAEAFADAVHALMSDPARAEIMGARGRERTRTEFTWDRVVDGYLTAYEEVLSRPARGSQQPVSVAR